MIIGVDGWNDRHREWHKRWLDLDANIHVLLPQQFAGMSNTPHAIEQVILIMIHSSQLDAHTHTTWDSLSAGLQQLSQRPYVMRISASGAGNSYTELTNFEHETVVAFPNHTPLGHLRTPLMNLFNRLSRIDRSPSCTDSDVINQRRAAWEAWEREAVLGRGRVALPALAILCQGYLVAHATANERGLAEALQHIGWGRLAPVRQVELAGRAAATEAVSWWQTPFRGYADLERIVERELAEQPLGEGLSELLAAIQQRQGRIDLPTVINAYRELAVILGGEPWPT